MKRDIVERLLDIDPHPPLSFHSDLRREAADEIERLRVALRAVRDEIIYGGGEFEEPDIDKIYDAANKALKHGRT